MKGECDANGHGLCGSVEQFAARFFRAAQLTDAAGDRMSVPETGGVPERMADAKFGGFTHGSEGAIDHDSRVGRIMEHTIRTVSHWVARSERRACAVEVARGVLIHCECRGEIAFTQTPLDVALWIGEAAFGNEARSERGDRVRVEADATRRKAGAEACRDR